MDDSEERNALAEKRERNREQRVEAVERWVEYIQSTPVDDWGPQHKAVVNSQLEAAREAGLSAEHYERVERAGETFQRERDA